MLMEPIHYKNRQQGIALVLSLIVLAILTLLGVVALRSSLVEVRSVSNAIEQDRAFSAAEIGLREAEKWLRSLDEPPQECAAASECTGFSIRSSGLAKLTATQFFSYTDEQWNQLANQSQLSLIESIQPGYFLVQWIDDYIDDESGVEFFIYEITAIGYGREITSRNILQSTFINAFDDNYPPKRMTWRYIRDE